MSRAGGVRDAPENRAAIEWAGAILVNSKGEFLLNLRAASRLLFPNQWDLIGGTLEPGEAAAACMLREVTEETGVVLESIEYRQAFEVRLNDGRAGRMHVFVGELDCPASELLLGEGQEHRFFSPQHLDAIDVVPGTREVLLDFIASPSYQPRDVRISEGDAQSGTKRVLVGEESPPRRIGR